MKDSLHDVIYLPTSDHDGARLTSLSDNEVPQLRKKTELEGFNISSSLNDEVMLSNPITSCYGVPRCPGIVEQARHRCSTIHGYLFNNSKRSLLNNSTGQGVKKIRHLNHRQQPRNEFVSTQRPSTAKQEDGELDLLSFDNKLENRVLTNSQGSKQEVAAPQGAYYNYYGN